jgi:hypothetical protein
MKGFEKVFFKKTKKNLANQKKCNNLHLNFKKPQFNHKTAKNYEAFFITKIQKRCLQVQKV